MAVRVPEAHELAQYSQVLQMVAAGRATTRATLARATELSRSTVSQRVDALVRRKLLVEIGPGLSRGGRPAVGLELNPDAGVVLSADLGASHARLAVADLGARIVAEHAADLDIGQGPLSVLGWVVENFRALLNEAGRAPSDVRSIGIGVPGPVNFSTGTPVRPPIMPGWDGFDVRGYVQAQFPVSVLVDNDVNLMALGEFWGRHGTLDGLLFVKIGTGIGCGIISHGQVHRGADGAAGDIGHVRVADKDDFICQCGNTGCVEAVASGSAIAKELRAAGVEANSSADVVRLGIEGNALARRQVRLAGQCVGEVLASVVSFYNPTTIVVGGALAQMRDDLLAGVRSVVYQRALPLATRNLTIETSQLEQRAGVTGGAVLASQNALSTRGLAEWLTSEDSAPG